MCNVIERQHFEMNVNQRLLEKHERYESLVANVTESAKDNEEQYKESMEEIEEMVIVFLLFCVRLNHVPNKRNYVFIISVVPT